MLSESHLILASASPRRRELLMQLGISFQVLPVNIDETQHPGESPTDYVKRLAWLKARTACEASADDHPVLGADTTVELEGALLGKPRDRLEALTMLARLSGREHCVYSGVAVATRQRYAQCVSRTRVCFRTLSADERRAYVESREPLDKAGAYAIQGRAAVFIRELHGSYSGVVGLPLFETAALLRGFGIRVL
jgi:nucleoside triphosphate pyrophosphatase